MTKICPRNEQCHEEDCPAKYPHEVCDDCGLFRSCPACIPVEPEPSPFVHESLMRQATEMEAQRHEPQPETTCPDCGHKAHKGRCTELVPLERYNDRDLFDYRSCGCTPAEPDSRKVEKHCPKCGHDAKEHDCRGCKVGYFIRKNEGYCNCTFTGKCTAEWRESNCLDKETCPTLSDGSICTHYEQPTPTEQMPLIELADPDKFEGLEGMYVLGRKHGARFQRDADMAWLPAHDQQVRREFAEKIPYLLRKVEGVADDPISKRASNWQWVIEKDELEAHIRAMAREEGQ